MQCTECKTGEVSEGTTKVSLHSEETSIVVKDVPAPVCDQCGVYYMTPVMTNKMTTIIEAAEQANAEHAVFRWPAVTSQGVQKVRDADPEAIKF